MSGDPWFRFFPSDWISGVSGLSAAERGVYVTLLAIMYDHGAPVFRDDARLSRQCGLPKAGFVRALDGLIKTGKIIFENGCLFNFRVKTELTERENRKLTSSDAAKSRWEKHKKKQDSTDENALSGQCDHNATRAPLPQPQPQPLSSFHSEEPRQARRSKSDEVKAHRLPKEWEPTTEDRSYGRNLNLTNTHFESALESMRIWAWSNSGAKTRKLDWSLTFRGFLRRDAEKLQNSRAGPGSFSSGQNQYPRRQTTADVFLNIANEIGLRNGTRTAESDLFAGEGDGPEITLVANPH